jgi:hypothetical protein
MKAVLTIIAVLLLAACGGAPEPDRSTIEPVACHVGNTSGVCT